MIVREAHIKRSDGKVTHKPDFILLHVSKDKVEITIIDPAVISCLGTFKRAHQIKVDKYDEPPVHNYLRNHFTTPHEVTYTSAIIDWRGCWYDDSFASITKLGFRETLLENISLEVLYWTNKIAKAYNKKYCIHKGLRNTDKSLKKYGCQNL